MPTFIPDEIIDEIKSHCDIVEVIQAYLPLKKSGISYKALCPFHNEKTPSFNVNPARQMFYCFGCGKGGDSITFVMMRENVDYITALKLLSEKYGIKIPEKSSGSGRSAGGDKDRLYSMNEQLAEWFRNNLINNVNPAVSAYLKERLIDDKIAEKFKLGASPNSWDDALKFLSKKGFTEIEMIDSGAVTRNPDNGNIYDRFRNRLIFPIFNEQGRTVGFSARSVEPDVKEAKYVNSPESPVFKKGRILYALDKARDVIREKAFSILCEGQLDVMAMHTGGFENAIAPQGTAFTEEQAGILKRYAAKVFICFDADEAGRKAALRAIELLLGIEVEPFVICLTDNEDPDSILRKHGKEALENCVRSAMPFFDYLLKNKIQKNSALLSPWEKNTVSAEIIPYILKIKNNVIRSSYCGILAGKLGVSETSLLSELNKHGRTLSNDGKNNDTGFASASANFAGSPEFQLRKAEATLLELCLVHGTFCKRLAEDMPSRMISSTAVGRALETAVAMSLNGEWENIIPVLKDKFLKENDPDLCGILATESEISSEPARRKAYNDCVNAIKTYHINADIKNLVRSLKDEKSPEKRTDIMRRISELKKELLKLHKI